MVVNNINAYMVKDLPAIRRPGHIILPPNEQFDQEKKLTPRVHINTNETLQLYLG